jgi:colanic acid/amylovoran biosynthesis glycosyltransferase
MQNNSVVAGVATGRDGELEPADSASSLLLDLAVPFRRVDGVLLIEAQAHDGIHRWRDNFQRVTVCAPNTPDALADPTFSWLPVDDLLQRGGVTFHELPWGYHPLSHLRRRTEVRELFRGLIATHRYLCLSNLGWSGAWGNIAAREATRMQRPYAVWLDWVLHEMRPRSGPGTIKKAVGAVRDWLEKRRSLSAVRNAGLGLFHGQTVYDAYAPISRNPHVVHDVHLKREDVISRQALFARLERAPSPLQLGYIGRVHEMKGPLQWIAAMERLSNLRPGGFQATWLGDGPMLDECRRQVALRGLQDIVFFPGGERDRPRVLEFFRSLDLFAFCHLTQESPRCLVEALMSGVPLVGYDSSYARELVSQTGGGDFVPVGDAAGLADRLSKLMQDAQLRQTLSIAALASGERFSVDEVFAHRSDLIKRYLGNALPVSASLIGERSSDSLGAEGIL